MSATPRPWGVIKSDSSPSRRAFVCARGGEDEVTDWIQADDAELIVRAVNAFDALIAVVEETVARLVHARDGASLPRAAYNAMMRDIVAAQGALALARGETP